MLTRTPVISSVLPSFEAVKIWDTDESNRLTLDWNENDTSDRTLNFLVAGGDRSLTIEADSLLNQDLTSDATPTFGGLRIAANGKILIGTTTAYGLLGELIEVHKSAGYSGITLVGWTTDANQSGTLILGRSNSTTIGTHTLVSNGDRLGSIGFEGSDGVRFYSAAYILGEVDGTPGVDDMPGRILFMTVPDGDFNHFERMRINNVGNIGINQMTFGTNAQKVVAIGAGTAPTTQPADAVQLYVSDTAGVAGKAGLFLLTEDGSNYVLGDVMLINATARYASLGELLEINKSANYGGIALNCWSATDDQASILNFFKSGSATIGTHAIVAADERLGHIIFNGSDGAAFKTAAMIYAASDGTPGLNDMPGRLVFLTTADGASGASERMRIDNQGNMGLGATSFGTSAAKVLALGTGTAPGSSPADMVQLYSADFAAGDARLYVRNEGGVVTFPQSGTLTTTSNKLSDFAATTSAELLGVISDETGSGALVFANTPTLVTPILGTPTSGTLTNCTGLPVAGVVGDTATALGVGSINLGHATDTTISRVSAGVIAVEGVEVTTLGNTTTGTGSIVRASSPTLVTPTLGVATATSINGLVVTTTAGTLTIANNASAALVTSGNYSLTLTATATTNVTLPTTGTLATLAGSETLSSKTLTSPVLQGNVDGWINDTNTWTYASASTFTISGDQTAIFTKGTRLKFTQTTVKYGVVVASSYGAPNTTVTILVNTDYTIANAAITSPAYSYEVNPQGYPGWFNIAAPTWVLTTIDDGAGGQPTTTSNRIRIDGNKATIKLNGNGTKVGNDWYIFHTTGNLPVPANYTASLAHSLGSCNTGWASNDRIGCITYHSVNGWGMLFDSHVNIPDNQVLTSFTYIAIYEF